MKKSLFILAFAGVSFTMLANTPVMNTEIIDATATCDLKIGDNVRHLLDRQKPVSANKMRKAAPAFDLNNYAEFTYFGMTAEDQDEQFTTIQFKQTSDTEVEIYGINYPLTAPVKAVYNPKMRTLTIATGQSLGMVNTSSGIKEYFFFAQMMRTDADGNIVGTTNMPSVVLTFSPEGVEFSDGTSGYENSWLPESSLIRFITNTAIDASTGFVGSWKYGNILFPLGQYFEEAPAFYFDQSEWYKIGDSTLLEDGWFGVLVQDYEPYDVETYRNIANPNLILLKNPWGITSPYLMINSTPTMQGYVILDLSRPDCVLTVPNVISGMTLPDLGVSTTLTATSKEGTDYFIDYKDYEDIIDDADFLGRPLPTLSEDGIVTLPNARYQVTLEMENPQQWSYQDGTKAEMVSKIQLGEGALGVEGITIDTDKAPKRYFNLQGQEISSPAHGEITIVKEGEKARKIINR